MGCGGAGLSKTVDIPFLSRAQQNNGMLDIQKHSRENKMITARWWILWLTTANIREKKGKQNQTKGKHKMKFS